MFKRLRNAGILGMNSRIGEFMLPHNSRKDYPKVDDKIITARLADDAGIPMPEIYTVIDSFGGLGRLGELLAQHESFVVKPARGSMGNGIWVITGHDGDIYTRSGNRHTELKHLRYHMAQILGGLYSLNGYPDRVIVQYLAKVHESFSDVSFNGVPDVRVIVFKGFPVMAMTRLPTRESGGRANLHQGALGAGIDLIRGTTTTCVHHNRIITRHPDTDRPLAGIEIPHWNEILEMAVRGFDLTGLGYLGVDIIIDNKMGPLLLEMNARPGLAIQLANMQGLKHRLASFGSIDGTGMSPHERVKKALELIPDGK